MIVKPNLSELVAHTMFATNLYGTFSSGLHGYLENLSTGELELLITALRDDHAVTLVQAIFNAYVADNDSLKELCSTVADMAESKL